MRPNPRARRQAWSFLSACALILTALSIHPVFALNDNDPAALATTEKDEIRIVLVGDSTVTDDSGWGVGFKRLLGTNAKCINCAKSGRSSKSYRDEGHWTKALAEQPDYILIQFGHNDQPGKGPERETDPKTTYRENLARYIDEARAAGAKPILVSPMTRRGFRGPRLVIDPLTDYAQAVKALAAEKKTPLVSLYTRSRATIEAMGQKAADTLGPTDKNGRPDRTHLNAEGSLLIAQLVVDELRRNVPELIPYLKPSSTDPDSNPER